VSHAWLLGTCTEAWVRNPTTPGQSPAPTPPPTPPVPPVPPIPPAPHGWLRWLIDYLLSLFGYVPATAHPAHPTALTPGAFGLTAGAGLIGVDWSGVIAWIKGLLVQYGPVIVPQIQAWIDALPVGPVVKMALHALVAILARQLLAAGA
jgi:hypothetical protein